MNQKLPKMIQKIQKNQPETHKKSPKDPKTELKDPKISPQSPRNEPKHHKMNPKSPQRPQIRPTPQKIGWKDQKKSEFWGFSNSKMTLPPPQSDTSKSPQGPQIDPNPPKDPKVTSPPPPSAPSPKLGPPGRNWSSCGSNKTLLGEGEHPKNGERPQKKGGKDPREGEFTPK